MEGTGLSHVLGLPELFHHSRHALLGLEGQPHRSAPRFGYDQDRRPAGHKKCLGAKSHTASVCTHWPLGPCYQAPGELAGEKLRPPPSSQPSLQGEVDLGAACSLRPPQPGAPFWRPSAGVSEVPGFSGGPSIFSRATLARGEGERVLALESREGTRASRRVKGLPSAFWPLEGCPLPRVGSGERPWATAVPSASRPP